MAEKVRSGGMKIQISKEPHSDVDAPPEEAGLTALECSAKSWSLDKGQAEKQDVTPLCEKESRQYEYALKDGGTASFDMFFNLTDPAYKAINDCHKDLKKRYIKVTHSDGSTQEMLGTVEQVQETANVGEFVNASITIGLSGKIVEKASTGIGE